MIFDRRVTVKLLSISQLSDKIEDFGIISFSNTNLKLSSILNLRGLAENKTEKSLKKQFRLLIRGWKIDHSFLCPMNITVGELKNSIIKHFKLEQYIEYSSILEIELKLTINDIIQYNNESMLLRDIGIEEESIIGIKNFVNIKKDEPGKYFGGGAKELLFRRKL